MNCTRLLLARHGNTFAPGEVVTRVGTTDLPLVESGLLQGRQLGAYLKHHQLIPDVIFTSQLKRARQTAEQLLQVLNSKLEINTLSMFNEIDYGPDENLPEEQVIARVGVEALQAWEAEAKVPNGWNVNPHTIIEDWQAFSKDIEQKFPNQTILVVTSNGIARFSPYLTGNFPVFAAEHGIKIATGALCIFEKKMDAMHWDCVHWNIKPAKEMMLMGL
jgi:2,3-bisphosphoglycerate-dependent phosphoglycerate mutase